MNKKLAEKFAREWIDSWNKHSIDELQHYCKRMGKDEDSSPGLISTAMKLIPYNFYEVLDHLQSFRSKDTFRVELNRIDFLFRQFHRH